MSSRPISCKRLHVLYTTPLLLGVLCIALILFSIFGLVPWGQTSGTLMVIHRTSSDAQDNHTASFHFGLLGQLLSRLPDWSFSIPTASSEPHTDMYNCPYRLLLSSGTRAPSPLHTRRVSTRLQHDDLAGRQGDQFEKSRNHDARSTSCLRHLDAYIHLGAILSYTRLPTYLCPGKTWQS
jgi:hypothetical protein